MNKIISKVRINSSQKKVKNKHSQFIDYINDHLSCLKKVSKGKFIKNKDI